MLPHTRITHRTLAPAIAWIVACGQSTAPVDRPESGPSVPPPAATPGLVTGTAVDARGAPIAGARVWILPAVTTGLLEATTDADGRYRVQGVATIPYRAYAWTVVTYRGKRVCLRLGAQVESDYDSFVPTTGVVRNFVLRLEGEIGANSGDRFGGDLRLFIPATPPGQRLVVTLAPDGPLLDGSTGRPLTFDVAASGLLLQGLPVGVYTASAAFVAPDGSRNPLQVSVTGAGDFASHVAVQWQTTDSCVGSRAGGPDRGFLWIQDPNAE